jgi:hypothetical protein
MTMSAMSREPGAACSRLVSSELVLIRIRLYLPPEGLAGGGLGGGVLGFVVPEPVVSVEPVPLDVPVPALPVESVWGVPVEPLP